MPDHDEALASAFDAQAPLFEVAPVQSDPVALDRLVRASALPPDSLVLDAGCGPGLVSAALLAAGHRVVGVDLSAEMIARARRRCAAAGGRATFRQLSLYDPALNAAGPFDGVLSRYVLHHVTDPFAFVARQVELLRPGGVFVLSDHVTDPDPARARTENEIERARDKTHTNNLSPGVILDLCARAGLRDLTYLEEEFMLDFDEWFDRGTPAAAKADVRARILALGPARGFRPTLVADEAVRIDSVRGIVRGVKVS